MPAGLADIVYYDENPVRPYVDYYCPIIEDNGIEEDDTSSHTSAEELMPRQTIIPAPRPARVRPYVFAYASPHGEQLALTLPSANDSSHGHQRNDPAEQEEYTPERLERLMAAHEDARQRSGGFPSVVTDSNLLLAIIEGLERL